MDHTLSNRYIAARRKIIASYFSGLNDAQREAVLATEGPLLLLAGAGSGKTTVVVNRIANILRFGSASDSDKLPHFANEAALERLEEYIKNPEPSQKAEIERLCALDPCQPWRVLAITFTNKAADELKARLESMLGAGANDIWARTFHSACVRILRRDADKIGFDNSFTIYDTTDSVALMKRIVKELELDEKSFPPKSILAYVGRAKDALVMPEELLAQAKAMSDIRRERIARAYIEYENRKKKANAMDFDDLIYYTVKLLEEHEETRNYYRRYFRYILIDEYQDTNNLQYRLAEALAGEHNNICVVGDDDQSIYKFRGATIENILSFESRHKNARMIRLEQNYRSTGNILDAANCVIRNNEGRKGKELWTKSDRGDKLTVYTAQNEDDEAQYVASRVMENFATGTNWRENVVLYRMNAQSNRVEFAFKRNGVPYRIVGGTKFFDRAEIKDVLSYLNIIINPDDDVRLLRVINTPPRGIGGKTLERVGEIALRETKSMYEVLSHAGSYPALDSAANKLQRFSSLMDELRTAAESLPLDELFDMALEKTGYIASLEEKSDENIGRIENIGELKTNIISYMRGAEEPSLFGFLDEVALYSDIDSLETDTDAVVMMTLHTAKGLEFENVYIIGVEEGLFPGIRSIGEPEEIEEERRLCYVGITRAKKKLTLTNARQRMIFGKTSSNMPSRFLEEIPEEYIEHKCAMPNSSFSGESSFKSSNSFGNGRNESRFAISKSPAPAPAKKPGDNFGYSVGDRIKHSAFGQGTVVKMTPMGGDFLIEVEFSEAVKKLMLRTAAPNMEKLN